MLTENIQTNSKKSATEKNFVSGQEVKWCPGCGDYSVLAQTQKALKSIGCSTENTVFISGIGCSSRFTYYMGTYGIHGIHGRPLAIASGLKLARPELDIWVVSGDGDCLSIGGNHFIHTLRRNFNLNVILLNNQIYALTKGQYSPTSEYNKKTKSTPYGSPDYVLSPPALALGANGSFVARSIDRDPKHLFDMITRSYQHIGTSFLEVYQNCNIFNDETFAMYSGKETKAEHVLILEDGKPLIFGANREKGIVLDGHNPKIVKVGDHGISEEDLWIHDEKSKTKAWILANLQDYSVQDQIFPMPFGVFYCQERTPYENVLQDKIDTARAKRGEPSFDKLLAGSQTWTVQ